jgi:AcrR family transcriptional regulator
MSSPDRPKLSRDLVLRRAVALADAEGIEAVSMRKLAQALGVEAMSLYNHVAGKDEVLDGMVEQVIAEIPLPLAGADWRAEMLRRGEGAHGVMMAHPWAPLLVVSRANAGPAMLAYVEATLAVLVGAGFSLPQADHIWNAMDSYIYGFTLQKLRFPFRPEGYADAARGYLPMIPQGTLPQFRALTEAVAERRHDGLHDFAFGFGLLLDGVDRLPRGA